MTASERRARRVGRIGSMLPATQIAKVVSGDRPSQLPTWHDSRLASVCDEVGGSNPRGLRARVRLRARLTAAAAHRHATAQLDCRRHGDEEEHRPVRQPGACRIRSQRSAWAHSTTPGGGVVSANAAGGARLKKRAIFWPRCRCSPVGVTDASARVGIATTEPATTAAASQGRARATRFEPWRVGGVVQSCSGVQRALCCCTGSARCAARKPAAVPMQQSTKSENGADGWRIARCPGMFGRGVKCGRFSVALMCRGCFWARATAVSILQFDPRTRPQSSRVSSVQVYVPSTRGGWTRRRWPHAGGHSQHRHDQTAAERQAVGQPLPSHSAASHFRPHTSGVLPICPLHFGLSR